MSDTVQLEKALAAHTRLADFRYSLEPVVKGYANRTLYIDLTTNRVEIKPVTGKMKELFTGGRGFCLWLLWNAIQDGTKWNDPENEIVIAGGPIGGITAYPGTGKCTVVTISPTTFSVIDSNAGGYFGPYLKFAGFDALEVQGKADEDVIIVIDGDEGSVRIEKAPLEDLDTHLINRQLTEMYAKDEKEMRGISVISAGQAADHAAICGLNVSYYDPKKKEVRYKQAARGGAGRVFRDKRIKAILVKYTRISGNSNGSADPELINRAGRRIKAEISEFDAVQNDMGGTGTPYLVEIMSKFDLLPVQNFRFGADDRAPQIGGAFWKQQYDRRGPDGCWYGCTLACAHGISEFELKTGPYRGQRVFVDGPEYETLGALGSNCAIFDPQAVLELNFYCDTYGIDTISCGNSIAFAMECYEYGILNSERTGGMELTWGNQDAVLEMVHQMARGQGFGVTVGQGIRAMKRIFAEKFGADPGLLADIGMEVKGMEISEYMPKESLAQQGGYALASKGPQHDEAWLIFMDMVHKQLPTFEDKAEALFYFPVWRTWFSLHGLCKLPWNDIIPVSNKSYSGVQAAKVPEHVENYCWLHEGVTGEKIDIEGILEQSERVYQFQRVFNLRLGYGTREFDIPPYRAMGPATVAEYESRAERYDMQIKTEIGKNPDGLSTIEKIRIVREYRQDRYRKLVDSVYARRGWTENGIPKRETLSRLGIDFPDLVKLVEVRGG